MIRLANPQFTFDQAIDECISGMANGAALRANVQAHRGDLIGEWNSYFDAAQSGNLTIIDPIVATDQDDDPIVFPALKKSDLMKAYKEYFAKKGKPARKIYDAIMSAAKESCPYCGGIGRPRNLDHFLPESHFPKFSILPYNLVPACRDCNMDGNPSGFATAPENQIIHPYADNDRFFITQWIVATYETRLSHHQGTFRYAVSPPDQWSAVDKKRVGKHFIEFDLAKRYAIRAAGLLDTTWRQMRKLQQIELSLENIIAAILRPGIDSAPFVNHWRMGMFQALERFIKDNPAVEF